MSVLLQPFSRTTFFSVHSIKRVSIAAKFEISKDKAGRFRFQLKAANGEIIAASQAYERYETKESAHKRIDSVKTNAASGAGPSSTSPNANQSTTSAHCR